VAVLVFELHEIELGVAPSALRPRSQQSTNRRQRRATEVFDDKPDSTQRDEALELSHAMRNMALWFRCDRGARRSLEPLNILFWQGHLTVIDFPQAVDPRRNRNAKKLLDRDVAKVCRYFARYNINLVQDWLTSDRSLAPVPAWLAVKCLLNGPSRIQ
jgi:hypothetical protein